MTLRPNTRFWQHKGNRIVTPANGAIITVEQLQTHLKVGDGLEDIPLALIIQDAEKFIEDISGIAFLNQTWRLTFDRWPGYVEPWWDGVREGSISELYTGKPNAEIGFPRYPLSSVTTVTTYDEDSNSTAIVIADTFDVDTNSIPGRMSLKRGKTWPINATRSTNAIEIDYVAGYGTLATDVPAPLRRAVLQMAAYFYSHRGDDCSVDEAYKGSGARGLVDRYKVRRI